jgi:hypothetical protein
LCVNRCLSSRATISPMCARTLWQSGKTVDSTFFFSFRLTHSLLIVWPRILTCDLRRHECWNIPSSKCGKPALWISLSLPKKSGAGRANL